MAVDIWQLPQPHSLGRCELVDRLHFGDLLEALFPQSLFLLRAI